MHNLQVFRKVAFGQGVLGLGIHEVFRANTTHHHQRHPILFCFCPPNPLASNAPID
jgi:hypothetical protein